MSITTGMSITAQATNKSADQAISWVKSKLGQSIDWDGAYGAQCVDLIAAYYNYLGVSSPGGNGCDYATNALPSGWSRTKGGTPKKGDILVYSASSSNPYGHVGIYEADYSHYHQNVSGQYVQCITGWRYNGFNDPYWGCIHPNFSGDDTLIGPTNVQIRSAGKKLIVTWDAVKGANCYDVILTDPSGVTNWYHSSNTEKTINISKLGNYKVDVQSLYRPNGNTQGQTVGGHSSVVSATISIFGPENLKVTAQDNNFYLKWDDANGANCYDVIATDPKGNSTWYHTNTKTKTLKINERPGKWSFRVQSLYRPNGSSQGQTVGGYSDYVTYNLQMTAPKNIRVDNEGGTFNVHWDIVSGANCYDVVVTKPNGETAWLHSDTNNASTSKFDYGHYEFWIQGIYRTSSLNIGGEHSETISFDYKPNPEFCEHKWNDAVISKQPTCTSTGIKTYVCSICGDRYTQTINKLSHTPADTVKENKVPATCKTKGSYELVVYCSECGEELSRETQTIPKTDHTPAAAVKENEVKATYDKAGSYDEVVYCSVCGEELSRETNAIAKLEKTSLSKATVSGIKDKTYTGKALTQSIAVKLGSKTLKNGTDYKITYTNNKSVGKATVKIEGINAYSGTISKTFKINPKATTLSKVTAGSKSFTATWKKQATQTTGYEIQYATDSKFTKGKKTVTVSKNSTVKTTVKKLTAKKKYYVRIRTYKTVSGTKYYSAWSATKTVTTKK